MRYAIEAGADLYLAGHTHGGQVFPGTWLIRQIFPYARGRFELDGMTLLVSQGAGTFGPPLRLGTFAEIQVIKLVPGPPDPREAQAPEAAAEPGAPKPPEAASEPGAGKAPEAAAEPGAANASEAAAEPPGEPGEAKPPPPEAGAGPE
jgi:hypothetical protein